MSKREPSHKIDLGQQLHETTAEPEHLDVVYVQASEIRVNGCQEVA